MAETNEYMTTRQYAISRDRDYGTCRKIAKKMWENGKETHCIGEFEEITDENGEESNAENVKRESNGDL